MKTVSFKPVGAPSPAPAAPEAAPANEAAPAQPAPATPAPVTSTAVVPAASNQLAHHEGADEGGVDASDVKLPRLKLLQGTSEKKLLQKFGFGALLFKDSVLIARAGIPGDTPETSQAAITGRLVFVRLMAKTYTEKVAKFGDPSLFAKSLAEVDQLGATTDWRESKENKKSGSNKPWMQVNAVCLVLVEKPDSVKGDDEDHFPFEADGKAYAPAMYTVKSFAYDAFFKEIATAHATGELRKGGYSSRFIHIHPSIQPGKGNAEFAVPTISFGERTSEAVRAIAAELA